MQFAPASIFTPSFKVLSSQLLGFLRIRSRLPYQSSLSIFSVFYLFYLIHCSIMSRSSSHCRPSNGTSSFSSHVSAHAPYRARSFPGHASGRESISVQIFVQIFVQSLLLYPYLVLSSKSLVDMHSWSHLPFKLYPFSDLMTKRHYYTLFLTRLCRFMLDGSTFFIILTRLCP